MVEGKWKLETKYRIKVKNYKNSHKDLRGIYLYSFTHFQWESMAMIQKGILCKAHLYIPFHLYSSIDNIQYKLK